jgi:hypothetical protein
VLSEAKKLEQAKNAEVTLALTQVFQLLSGKDQKQLE